MNVDNAAGADVAGRRDAGAVRQRFPEALTLLKARASAIRLTEPAPSDAELASIFECAVNAPDHGRLRPWHFIVIRGKALEAFGTVLAEAHAATSPDATPERLAQEKAKALRAPVIVIAVARPAREGKVPVIEQVVAVGAAVENLMLAAQALGYGAMWRTGAAAYSDLVKKRLKLEQTDSVVGIIYLGTADATSKLPRPTVASKVTEWTV